MIPGCQCRKWLWVKSIRFKHKTRKQQHTEYQAKHKNKLDDISVQQQDHTPNGQAAAISLLLQTPEPPVFIYKPSKKETQFTLKRYTKETARPTRKADRHLQLDQK
jgi:hypothetical protein